jgi:inorganic triphosphatase YgiF
MIHPDPATSVEVSCDEGRIETAAGTMLPVCEMALELKTGEPQALFELARALNEAAPLRIETRSKAARGYGLLAGEGDDRTIERGRGRVELRPELPAEEALSAILRRELWQMLAHDQAALGGEAEGVHQMRVALRRLRAIFSLFKAMIPEEQRAWATGEMKWIAGSLGDARNWDVFAEYVQPLAGHFTAAEDGIIALSQAALDGRSLAYKVVQETLTAPRYTDFALRLMAWTESRGWRQQSVSETSVNLLSPVGDLAADLLDRRHRKARKLARRFDELPPEDRHKLRIAVKKLRYATDSLRQLYGGKAVKRYLKSLGGLQDDLGVMNDIAGMRGLLEKLQTVPGADGVMGRGAALMLGWYGKVLAERETKLVKKLRRFLGTKPFWRRAEA